MTVFKPLVKIYGERNTGTNYLAQLMQKNMDIQLLRGEAHPMVQKISPWLEWPRNAYFAYTFADNLGWKHAVAVTKQQLYDYALVDRLSFITLTKNPYSWLLSIYHRPYHFRKHKGDLIEFINKPWPVLGRENFSGSFETPMAMWNIKNQSYCALRNYAPAINLRYEDLLANPEAMMWKIAELLSIKLDQGNFTNIDESTKGDQRDFDDYQDYYLNERWREKLSAREISQINKSLDFELAAYFRYERL